MIRPLRVRSATSLCVAMAIAGCWTSSSDSKAPSEPVPQEEATWTPERTRTAKQEPLCDEVMCLVNPPDDPTCCEKLGIQPKPRPTPPPPPPSLPPTLDRHAIQSTVGSVKAAIVKCGDQQPTAKGTLKIQVAVAPSGMANVTVVQSLDPAIDACVVKVLERTLFPAAQNATTFVYPLLF